jgi:hypothetical protein
VTPAEVIEAAELAEAETRYRHQLASEMYARGRAEAGPAGYARAVADIKAVQHGIVRDAQLETARWGPGGRAHFADPRPGDFPGRAAEREPEPDPEREPEPDPEREMELEAG